MDKKILKDVLENNFKNIDAIFIYKDGTPLAYKFAPYLPDNPDTFFTFNQEIEKIYKYLDKIQEGKLYHYGTTIGKKDIYMFIYKVKDEIYIFVFLNRKDLELSGIVMNYVMKPLSKYLALL